MDPRVVSLLSGFALGAGAMWLWLLILVTLA
jgi:hypothetical protein